MKTFYHIIAMLAIVNMVPALYYGAMLARDNDNMALMFIPLIVCMIVGFIGVNGVDKADK